MIVMKLNKQIKISFYIFSFICLVSLFFILTNSNLIIINKIFGIIICLLTPLTILTNYWHSVSFTSYGIEIHKLFCKKKHFLFSDVSINIKHNQFNKQIITISFFDKNEDFFIYYWMTNFQEAIDFLRKNGKLS
jgi:hypothetical protein